MLPREAAGRGLTRTQQLRRRIGRTLAGAGCVEVVSFPFVGDATFDALGLPADDVLRQTVPLANPLSAEEPAYTTTLLPGVLKAAGRNIGRGARASPCSRPAPSRSLSTAARRRSTASTAGRTTPTCRSCSTRCPGSPSTWPSSSPASGSGPAGGARDVPPAGPMRSGWSAGSPPSSASPSRSGRAAGCRGTRAAARSSSIGRRRARARRRAAPPGVCRSSGSPRGARPSRSTSTC